LSAYLDLLVEKALKAKEEMVGKREGKVVTGIFERLGYMTAESFKITNYPRKPLVAFNPSATVRDDKLYLFVRFVFDYYDYVSSIGVSEVELEAIDELSRMVLDSKIVIYPSTKDEIKRGAEDPRAHNFEDGFLIFYTAVGLRDGELWPKQAVAVLDKDFNVKEKGILKLGDYIPPAWKNTAMVNFNGKYLTILTRPLIEGHEVIWRAPLLRDTWTVDPEEMEVAMVAEPFELKVGVSTPPVRLSSNELLIGWHAIYREDLSYRNGIAIITPEGEIIGISEYLLTPSTIEEMYGDRPMVIYGCGLVKKDEYIYWIGGVADYGIGIYRAEIDKVLEHVKWLRG